MPVRALRGASVLTCVLLAAGLWQAADLARRLHVTSASLSWMALFIAWAVLLLAVLLLAWRSFLPAGDRLADRIAQTVGRVRLPGLVARVLFAACCLLLPLILLTPLPDPAGLLLELAALRGLLFWLLALASAACLQFWRPAGSAAWNLALAALLLAAVYRAAVFLPEITTYPFSLGWSEGSRYYYASLFLAQDLYGTAANPSVLHPTRYMMQAVPFLVDGLPLWFHRAWQVFLWLGTNALAAGLLVRRLRVRAGQQRVLLALWAFLFLFQAPVWYHLVVIVILVLWGAEASRFWRTLAVVAAASVWAGMSRVNWIPFPAALAALLYLLEVPRAGKSFMAYFGPPLAWGVTGTALGLASQAAYALLSGNALDHFGSSFTSDLLWYRLFPSATFPLGVVPAILLATAPVLWLVRQRLGGRAAPGLRGMAIVGLLLVFFGGGLVVSAKIGGGSNLHNMDGYIVLLMVLGAYAAFDLAEAAGKIRPAALALAIAVPVAFALGTGAPPGQPRTVQVAQELAELDRLVEAAAAQGGEVLFIAQRHLLLFGPAAGTDLVEEYEKVFLMEMAMAGNQAYLGRFAQDLAAHRFALIVSDVVNFNPQTRDDQFGEENNAWDRHVTYPLLCHYQEVQTLDQARVELLAPREATECPVLPPEWLP